MDDLTRQIIRDILHDKRIMTFAISYSIGIAIITLLTIALIQRTV